MINNEFEQSYDLKAFLDENGIKYFQNQTHFTLDKCPVCGGKDKFCIDKKSKKWVCFRCVKTNDFTIKEGRGNLYSFFKLLGLTHQEIKHIYDVGDSITYTQYDGFKSIMPEVNNEANLLEVSLPYDSIKLDCTKENLQQNIEAYRYLFKRHVNDMSVYHEFDLRYSKQMQRIIFPVKEFGDKIVGWQARDITDRYKSEQLKCTNNYCGKWYFNDESKCPLCNFELEKRPYPKALNSKNFPKIELFYNQNNVTWYNPNPDTMLTLVEGPFDCINTPNSIALLGKVLSAQQLNILLANKVQVMTLYLDGDKAGRMSTEMIINMLEPFMTLFVVPLEDGDDPGSHSREDNYLRLINTSIPAKDWLKKYSIF